MADKILRAVTTNSNFRIVIVWMPETANIILNQHKPSAKIGEHLVDSAAASLLLASGLKGSGAISLRYNTSGIIGLMNSDGTPDGFVRAMVSKANIEDEKLGNKLKLPLLGQGTLTVTKIYNDSRKPYNGIVNINSNEISSSISSYLLISEQIKSFVSIDTLFKNEKVSSCCGILIEALPNLQEEDLVKMEENSGKLLNLKDSLEQIKQPEEIYEELTHGFESEIVREIPINFFCPCTKERVVSAILSAGKENIKKMKEEESELEVFCDYCRKRYLIKTKEL